MLIHAFGGTSCAHSSTAICLLYSFCSSVHSFAVPLTSDTASLLSPLRLANASGLTPHVRDLHSLAFFKRTIFIIQGTHIKNNSRKPPIKSHLSKRSLRGFWLLFVDRHRKFRYRWQSSLLLSRRVSRFGIFKLKKIFAGTRSRSYYIFSQLISSR